VGVCYRSPLSSVCNNEELLSLLRSVSALTNSNNSVIIMGDFNLPNVNSNTMSVHGTDSFAAKFCECVGDIFWYQHVTDFTRYRDRQAPSCLDWIFTYDPDMLEELTYEEPLGKSDT